MKRTPLKRTPLKRKTPLQQKTSLRAKFAQPKRVKSKPALESWVKAIPENKSHGSGTYQKRLWKLVSDSVRIRDWYKYPYCVATGKRIEHWKDGQAGHYRHYSKCNGMFKFDMMNIHLQGAQSNGFGSSEDWDYYKEELKRRHGNDYIEKIDEENKKHHNESVRDSDIKKEMRRVLYLMANLPEQPDYYKRAKMLIETYEM